MGKKGKKQAGKEEKPKVNPQDVGAGDGNPITPPGTSGSEQRQQEQIQPETGSWRRPPSHQEPSQPQQGTGERPPQQGPPPQQGQPQPQQGPPQQGQPQQGPPRKKQPQQKQPQQEPPQQGPPLQGPPLQEQPQQGPPRKKQPQKKQPQQGQPQQGQPQKKQPQQGQPQQEQPQQGQPQPQQGPPRQKQPQQGPPQQGPPQLQQGAWGRPPPQQGQPPQQDPSQQQQGAWGRPPPQQGPPLQQGAWGRPPPQQGPPLQQGAWGRPPPQQDPSQRQQGAWGRPPSQQGPPQSQQGAWGRPPPQQGPPSQQGPPHSQQGAWGRPPPAAGEQRPQPKQGTTWGEKPPFTPEQSPRRDPPRDERFEKGSSQGPHPSDSQSELFEFAPKICAARKSGTPIVVATNFFRLYIKNPDITIYHYNVVIEPDKPKYLLREVWNKFASKMFPRQLTGFDGKNAYSKSPLGNGTVKATVTVFNSENNKNKDFNVSIEEVRKLNLSCLKDYMERMSRDKSMKILPEAETAVLEIIIRNWACDNYVTSGKHFFPPAKSNPPLKSLSGKLDLKVGYFQSVFMGWVPYVNFDISHKAFYRECPVLEVAELFRQRNGTIDEEGFNRFMRSVKIEYQLPNNPDSRREYRVNKLVDTAARQTFSKDDGSKITVAQYFAQEKKCKLSYPDYPLLWVGPTQKSIYVPMEFCRVLPDQVYRGLLESMEQREMVRSATCNANERARQVMNLFSKIRMDDNSLMREFGLSVAKEMEKVPARVLPAPSLLTAKTVRVEDGVWRFNNLYRPVNLNKWCVLTADQYVRRENVIQLQNLIKSKGREFNMNIGDPKRDPMNVEPSLAALKRAFSQLKDMEMVFVIISEAKGLYSKVKTICETQEGVLTQCIKSKTVSQDAMKLGNTVKNILLKVNTKLGGKNHTLGDASFPPCLKGYVMVVGADVTHPSPGVRIPSVAAVAVSCDPEAFQYDFNIRLQPKGEMILDLQEIISMSLKKFYRIRGRYPEKIIFYRDGVSEGELPKVFKKELLAVKNACGRLCQPQITFLVVQKRHHARFFATRREDECGKNFNVPVGTCVDSHIVHPRDLDFYLLSHNSILGTARPTRYRLLYDDSKLTDDELERMSFYLCHMCARCSRSLSYPAPTYYAHLSAFRARAYLEGNNVTNDNDISGIQKKMTDNISAISPMFYV